jgi:hypothetical protein
LRFVVHEIHWESRVESGIFTAAYRLYYSGRLPDYEDEQMAWLLWWFESRLEFPTRFSRSKRRSAPSRGVCWFRETATEHISKVFEMRLILEENGVLTRMLKAPKVGYVVYEDEHQVVAEPFADMNL